MGVFGHGKEFLKNMMDENSLQPTPLASTDVMPAVTEFAEREKKKENRFFAFFEKRKEGALPIVLAFLLPMIIFGICLAFLKVYPFGDGQFINYDGWHQYYPFVMKLWDHFHEGTSLLYDWSMGMGTNFLSMLSYYGASPLNLLLYLAPERDFRLLFMLFSVLRIGLAGLFTALFFRKVFSKPGWSVAFFALGYALSGYVLGYYWNNMWLDSVALYPLLCLATVKLFREGKSALYVLVMAVSLFSNYYIGYMSALFTVLVFVALCVLDKVCFSDFIRKGFRLLLMTFLGIGLAAVMLLPAFFGLLNTFSTSADAPKVYVDFYESIRDFLMPLSSFHEPTVIDGLPNLTTSALLILFAFAFLWAKRISLREKLVAFFTVLFLLLSMNFSVLNYIWHGMHFTNQIPYRFAYLFAFVVVLMAYLYYRKAMEGFDWIDAVGMLIFSALIAFCAFGYYANVSVLATVAVFVLGMLLTALYSVKIFPRRILSFAVCVILVAEIGVNTWLGTKAVGVTSYEQYFDLKTGEEFSQMVAIAEEREKNSLDFYRLEGTEWRSLNDSCFYDYNGISQFASSANYRVAAFLQALGMPADPGSNRFVYVHGTPLGNTMLGVKYLVSREGYESDKDLTCISKSDNETTAALYQCNGFAGLGFMIDENALAFSFDMTQPVYERQNALFRAVTGLEGDLLTPFQPTEISGVGLTAVDSGGGSYELNGLELSEEEGTERVLRLTYTMPTDSTVYLYADVPSATHVQVNNAWHALDGYPNFFSAGAYEEGEGFHVRAALQETGRDAFTDGATIYACTMDTRLWEQGLARLQDEKMEITSFENTRVEAKITAKQDGVLYTSIPAELEGSWEVSVDGKQVKIGAFAGSFLALPLTEGEHSLVFRYSPLGFEKGLGISFVSLLLLIALAIWERKGHKLFPEKSLLSPEGGKKQMGEGDAENDVAEADEPDPQGD